MTTTTKPIHTFHIPVMGLAYTIDSPIRVAQYGISSVVSIADDELIEKMNAFYHQKFNLPYKEISQRVSDYRAKRITSYLNLMDKAVKEKFECFKKELTENKESLENYIAILPNTSEIKTKLQNFLKEGFSLKNNLQKYLEKHISAGAIDVNIMTKLDKDNFDKTDQLPIAFNDAHAALRGYANSNLESSIVFSAGMNPRLFSYIENFNDFYPDNNNHLKKKITLKVSDFRSALIQGNFLAKKGLWVSEYRIESGLNCGGHAFATEGFLLGPILEEFHQKRNELIQTSHDLMVKALVQKQRYMPENPLALKITVQGGVGTAEEQNFLLDEYNLDSVGWGSPFLLVPEATCVDPATRALLKNATESDLYLSQISPLGVPFNTLRGTSNERIKLKRIQESKAGSSCPKKYLALNKDAKGKGICTASKKYQIAKLEELENTKSGISQENYEKARHQITEKSCLCVGLANSSYLENNILVKGQDQGIVICPGPNMAYFDQEVSLKQMVRHIYGNTVVMNKKDRPNLFVKELKMYIDYLKNDIQANITNTNTVKTKKLESFKKNLLDGIDYYLELMIRTPYFNTIKKEINDQLQVNKNELISIVIPELATA